MGPYLTQLDHVYQGGMLERSVPQIIPFPYNPHHIPHIVPFTIFISRLGNADVASEYYKKLSGRHLQAHGNFESVDV